jgi:hypothetical protein
MAVRLSPRRSAALSRRQRRRQPTVTTATPRPIGITVSTADSAVSIPRTRRLGMPPGRFLPADLRNERFLLRAVTTPESAFVFVSTRCSPAPSTGRTNRTRARPPSRPPDGTTRARRCRPRSADHRLSARSSSRPDGRPFSFPGGRQFYDESLKCPEELVPPVLRQSVVVEHVEATVNLDIEGRGGCRTARTTAGSPSHHRGRSATIVIASVAGTFQSRRSGSSTTAGLGPFVAAATPSKERLARGRPDRARRGSRTHARTGCSRDRHRTIGA